MNLIDAVICVLFTTLAASYAWGMRGAVIGGEKGAMLPGAFIGLILAWFSGGGISESYWIPAAAGLMGMTFGGIETYGETIGFVLHRGQKNYRPIKGYSGLALKGALWFSICGGIIAFSLASMSGSIYSTADIIIFCLLIPAIQQIGYRIFNTPYDKEKGIHPKSYYSLTRREEWGSNLALLIAMLAMAVIKGDDLMLSMICGGFIAGAFGWIIAMRAYELSEFPKNNRKYAFNKLRKTGIFDGWKLMEFILGAFGGMGLSLGFCFSFDNVAEYNGIISLNGRKSLSESAERAMFFVAAMIALAMLAVNIYQLVCEKKNKKTDSFILDQIERPLYNVIPMMFVLLGSVSVARIMTVFMLVFVCVIKCVFDRFDKSIYRIVFLPICAVLFAGDLFLGGYSPFEIMLAGTVPYLIAELLWTISKQSRKDKSIRDILTKTSFATVYPCFIVMSAAILLISYKIFGV